MTKATRTRRTPEERRAQLLDLGVQMLAERPLAELSMEELAGAAGISKALVFHYFGSKAEFQVAVASAAADEFFAVTEPDPTLDLDGQLDQSMCAFVRYVSDHREGYLMLVRGVSGGDGALGGLFTHTRDRFVRRIVDKLGPVDVGAPLLHLAVRGWVAFAEEVTVGWADDPTTSEDELLVLLRDSLTQIVALALGVPAGSLLT